MPNVLIDTNVLLRFVRSDHAELSSRAEALFFQAGQGEVTLLLRDMVVAEAVWVLTSHYKTARVKTASVLSKLLTRPGIRAENLEVMLLALEHFKTVNVDFMDCYLAAVGELSQTQIASFDEDSRKFKGIKRLKL